MDRSAQTARDSCGVLPAHTHSVPRPSQCEETPHVWMSNAKGNAEESRDCASFISLLCSGFAQRLGLVSSQEGLDGRV